jgi:soluble lytic murein transglycosylase-like protein
MKLKEIFISFCLFVVIVKFAIDKEEVLPKYEGLPSSEINETAPPCVRMYDAINKWSSIYNIPKHYAYGIAYKETSYRGPFDWKYRHNRTSCVGAIGAMQIMPSTANFIWKQKISKDRLMNDIDFNVQSSMKYLRQLYNIYGDWKITFGYYNTGYPKVNQYALDVVNHVPKWKMN